MHNKLSLTTLALITAAAFAPACDDDGGGEDTCQEDSGGDSGDTGTCDNSGGGSGGGETFSCETFCDELVKVCPSDTSCVSSCESSGHTVSESDLDCVLAARDCDETNACFMSFFR